MKFLYWTGVKLRQRPSVALVDNVSASFAGDVSIRLEFHLDAVRR